MAEAASERQAEFAESQRLEAARIAFLERDRGKEAARVFAIQTLRSYRRAVVHRAPPAGEQRFRLRLLASYRYLKRYVRS
ncbi:MAG: hypothetical protein J5I81_12220 [Nitrococcus mobilis]|nr:hypothetical protein [Nitrococcus mobilis]